MHPLQYCKNQGKFRHPERSWNKHCSVLMCPQLLFIQMSNYPGFFAVQKLTWPALMPEDLGMFSQGQSFWTESETGETTLLQPKGGCRVGMREGGGYHSSHQHRCACFPPGDATQGKPHKMPQLRGNACAHSQMAKINHAQGKSTGDPGSICSSTQGTDGCLL